VLGGPDHALGTKACAKLDRLVEATTRARTEQVERIARLE
jgi:hypothetical protein